MKTLATLVLLVLLTGSAPVALAVDPRPASLDVAGSSVLVDLPCPRQYKEAQQTLTMRFANDGDYSLNVWGFNMANTGLTGFRFSPASFSSFTVPGGGVVTKTTAVYVPDTTMGGTYYGTLTVSWGGGADRSLPLTVEVRQPIKVELQATEGDLGELPLLGVPVAVPFEAKEVCGYQPGTIAVEAVGGAPSFVGLAAGTFPIEAGSTAQATMTVGFDSRHSDLLYARQQWTVRMSPQGSPVTELHYAARPVLIDESEQLDALAAASSAAWIASSRDGGERLHDLVEALVQDLRTNTGTPVRSDVVDASLMLSLTLPFATAISARQALGEPDGLDGWRGAIPKLIAFASMVRPMEGICEQVVNMSTRAECADAVAGLDADTARLLRAAEATLLESAAGSATPYELQQSYAGLARIAYALDDTATGNARTADSKAQFEAFTDELDAAERAEARVRESLAPGWTLMDLGGNQRIAWHPFAALQMLFLDDAVTADLQTATSHYERAGDPSRIAQWQTRATDLENLAGSSWIPNIMVSTIYLVGAVLLAVRLSTVAALLSATKRRARLGDFLAVEATIPAPSGPGATWQPATAPEAATSA